MVQPQKSERPEVASLVGTNVGEKFRLLELIGEGGMGGVFRAEESGSGRMVALKLLHPELAHIEYIDRRFRNEAEAASRLDHPHIVKVLDCGQVDGHLYMAMELLKGRSLADLIARSEWSRKGRRISVERTLAIMGQVLDALVHAHERGIVHRDLKPENIMLVAGRDRRAPEQVKLLDFGIAKLGGGSTAGKPLTQAGIPLGTPHYMSPEQAAGEDTDARTDIYSCGVILYEMLTGRCPFEAASTVELLSMHLTKAPAALRTHTLSVPESLDQVVMRALSKHKAERYPTAAALKTALDEAGAAARVRMRTRVARPVVVAATAADADGTGATAARRRRWQPMAALAAGVIGVAALALAGPRLWRAPATTETASRATTMGTAAPLGTLPLGTTPPLPAQATRAQLTRAATAHTVVTASAEPKRLVDAKVRGAAPARVHVEPKARPEKARPTLARTHAEAAKLRKATANAGNAAKPRAPRAN